MKLSPTILISDANFHAAWARAVRYVLREGTPLIIGDTSEPKSIKDVCATIKLTGDAIRQIEDRELHPHFPFQHIDQYCEEFTRKYLEKYIEKPEHEQFTYLYMDRLARHLREYRYIDQLDALRVVLGEQCESGISSNRNQAITWQPEKDIGNSASPCFQRVFVRYLEGQNVEVHLAWRSHDLYTAWQVNIIALIDMLNREVIKPNNCHIVKIVDYSDSLHIYENDIEHAMEVKLVPVNLHDSR